MLILQGSSKSLEDLQFRDIDAENTCADNKTYDYLRRLATERYRDQMKVKLFIEATKLFSIFQV